MKTKRDLADIDDYDWKEATQVAIKQRKFLLNDLIRPIKEHEQKENEEIDHHDVLQNFKHMRRD